LTSWLDAAIATQAPVAGEQVLRWRVRADAVSCKSARSSSTGLHSVTAARQRRPPRARSRNAAARLRARHLLLDLHCDLMLNTKRHGDKAGIAMGRITGERELGRAVALRNER